MPEPAAASAEPDPVSWQLRAGAMPWIPGSADECLPRLRQVLDLVERRQNPDDPFGWRIGEGQTTLRAALRGLGRSGLFEREPGSGTLQLTPIARRWRDGDDETLLIRIFHANVKFVGELLSSFSDRMTHDDIRQTAKREYGIDWKTLDQVRRRTNWLRAVGALELWSNNDLVLLEPANHLLNALRVEPPLDTSFDVSEDEVATVPPSSGPRIQQLIEELDRGALVARNRAISYIPGGDTVSVLHQLVSTMETKVSREAFEGICSREFSISESSARTALGTLRAAGLVEQVGPNHFCATDIAQEWLETEDPLDLVRIFHANFVFVGEILDILKTARSSGDIQRQIEDSYDLPKISQEEVARRLRLLKSAGLVEEISNQVRLTSIGRGLSSTLPVLKRTNSELDSASARGDVSSVKVEQISESSRAAEASKIARELDEASTDSANWIRFEKVIEHALQYLGFIAKHIGGPKNTDVLVDCWLAPGSTVRVIVDAKTASSGVLDDLKFPALEEHRKKYGAQQTAVVAPSFDARLAGWADDQNVLFIEVSTLARWVLRHSVVAFEPAEIAALFQRDGEDALENTWTSLLHQYDVLRDVSRLLWDSANNTGHVAKSGGSFTPREVWLLMMSSQPDVEEAEISEALHLLASPLIGAVKKKSNGSFSAARSPDSVSERLQFAAAAVAGQASRIADQPVETLPGRRSRRRPGRLDEDDLNVPAPNPRDVRAWAKRNGLTASERGRLPKELVERYLKAQE